METPTPEEAGRRPDRRRSWVATAALATGLAVGAAGLAGAATGSSGSGTAATSTDAVATAPLAPPAGRPDPATMTNGPGETLLTGDAASKATAAAKAAVPGAEIIRVETDSGDATYEAHVKRSDGTYATVLMDDSFTVTSTEQGFGPGPQGQQAPGPVPRTDDGSTSASSE